MKIYGISLEKFAILLLTFNGGIFHFVLGHKYYPAAPAPASASYCDPCGNSVQYQPAPAPKTATVVVLQPVQKHAPKPVYIPAPAPKPVVVHVPVEKPVPVPYPVYIPAPPRPPPPPPPPVGPPATPVIIVKEVSGGSGCNYGCPQPQQPPVYERPLGILKKWKTAMGF